MWAQISIDYSHICFQQHLSDIHCDTSSSVNSDALLFPFSGIFAFLSHPVIYCQHVHLSPLTLLSVNRPSVNPRVVSFHHSAETPTGPANGSITQTVGNMSVSMVTGWMSCVLILCQMESRGRAVQRSEIQCHISSRRSLFVSDCEHDNAVIFFNSYFVSMLKLHYFLYKKKKKKFICKC